MNEVQARDEALSRAVREAFFELNLDSADALSRLSASRRLQMAAELADFARASYVTQARLTHPDASADEIEEMVRRRMREAQDGG